MRHCCPLGEATEILGVRRGMASELKQTTARKWVSPEEPGGSASVTSPRTPGVRAFGAVPVAGSVGSREDPRDQRRRGGCARPGRADQGTDALAGRGGAG